MNKAVVILLVGTIVLLACDARAEAPDATGASGGTEAAETILKEAHAQGLYPGLSLAARTAGGTIIDAQIGYADLSTQRAITAETMFRMYSVTKGLTAILTAVLVDENRIRLDAPIDRYLSALPTHLQSITVRQLLDHTSGIRHYRGTDEWLVLSRRHCRSPRDALVVFVNDPLLFAPGTKKSYSSFGYVLLSAVLEEAGGKPFATLMAEELFEAASARRIEFDKPQANNTEDVSVYYERRAQDETVFDPAPSIDNSCKFGGGAINASPLAVLKVYSAFYSGALTSEATLKGFAPALANKDEGTYISVGGEGLGGRSVAAAYPAKNVIVVIAANARGGNLESYARRIADALQAGE